MMKYATETQNLNCFLNVLLDFGIKENNGLTYCFNPDEYAALFRSLIKLNQRDLAYFILNELSETRENYRTKLQREQGLKALKEFDKGISILEKIGTKATSSAYDYVVKNQSIIPFCPAFTAEMLEPFYATLDTFDELDKLNKIMTKNKLPFEQKIIEHVFRYLDSAKRATSIQLITPSWILAS
ncbi:unnamed protein product [Ambrosiozyma monospora]|uniref:Unnamed protein product n=1 Tax=Ambrosiozyma monospora TaxID=43982 RepID=A0A9W6SWQ0_AMBMO|nr:unnamed protein product [Ambrosiozyma monospora]